MDYSVYNDYELLYLVHDGCEAALRLLHKKYYHLIYITAKEFYPRGDKIWDLIQEGRIVLQDCIFHFNPSLGVSFYSYFLLCFRRRIIRLFRDDYYLEHISLRDSIIDTKDYGKDFLYSPDKIFEDEEEQRIYQQVILDGITITQYAKEQQIPYMVVYRRYLKILDIIRKWVE